MCLPKCIKKREKLFLFPFSIMRNNFVFSRSLTHSLLLHTIMCVYNDAKSKREEEEEEEGRRRKISFPFLQLWHKKIVAHKFVERRM